MHLLFPCVGTQEKQEHGIYYKFFAIDIMSACTIHVHVCICTHVQYVISLYMFPYMHVHVIDVLEIIYLWLILLL